MEIEQTERVAFSLPRNNGISPQNTTSGGYLGDIRAGDPIAWE